MYVEAGGLQKTTHHITAHKTINKILYIHFSFKLPHKQYYLFIWYYFELVNVFSISYD